MLVGILSWKVDGLVRLLPDYIRNLNTIERGLIKSLTPSQMPDDYLSLDSELTAEYIKGLIEVITEYQAKQKNKPLCSTQNQP